MRIHLVILATAACRGRPAAIATESPSVRDVETTFRSGIAAFNRHSLAEFTEQFAPDIVMYTPTGWLRGGDAVRARFDSTFKQFPKVRMEIDSLEVRSTGPRSSTVAFRWRVFPMGAGPAFHGVGSGAYVERNGRWVEVLEHETVTSTDPALQRR